ncbi:hypothetical protein ACGFJC_01970 [Nonomuraea fuscirosea]|uniref:hypothetical protein n=1 Tax=Nonomuraea fuscirosea TaxID=1291556 RepID=UPI003444339A
MQIGVKRAGAVVLFGAESVGLGVVRPEAVDVDSRCRVEAIGAAGIGVLKARYLIATGVTRELDRTGRAILDGLA